MRKVAMISFLCLMFGILIGLSAHQKGQVDLYRDDSVEKLFSIPVGEEGIRYEGEGVSDMLTWGPTAFTVAPDGSFWIADTVSGRLLHYTKRGDLIASLDVSDLVIGIGDLEATRSDLYVLDIAALIPTIYHFSIAGEMLDAIEVPEDLRLDHGLSGLSLGEQGEVLIELEGGASLIQLLDKNGDIERASQNGFLRQGRMYQVRPADLSTDDAHRGWITTEDVRIPVEVTHSLGALRLLTVAPDGSMRVVVEEVMLDDTFKVDQTIRHYSAEGKLLASARMPLDSQHVFVAHGLAAGPDGSVFALLTKPNQIEIARLRFLREIPSILPDEPIMKDPNILEETTTQASPAACVSRDTMISIAKGFKNNSKYLNSTNINGSCSGRTKPRYLGSAGTYSSVSYDWGGWTSVSQFNNAMSSGSQAGDINTAAVESCSKGVDCSGFVTNCWKLTSKYSTCTLPNVSTKLSSTSKLLKGDIVNDCGNHVVLFNSFGSNGIYDYESTTSNSYDRVVYMFSSWSRLSGYEPRRYNNVCN